MVTVTQPTTLPRFTFVVTYGRSGSTLVQGLLNSMPGGLVRGENNLFVLPLFRSWSALRDFNKKYAGLAGERGVQSAFYGIDEFRPNDFAESVRDLVLPQLYGNVDPDQVDVLGFKEVLWHRVRPKETTAFFEFFDKVFPGARYVLHRRNHEDVTTSGFWRKQDPDSVSRALRRVEAIQDRLRESRPERTHDTHYERLTSDDPAVVDEELRTLAEFVLGSCDEALLAKLRETLGLGFGPKPFGRSKRENKAKPVRRDGKRHQPGRLAGRSRRPGDRGRSG